LEVSVVYALTLLAGRQEGHLARKNWMLVCWWCHFDWSFACIIAPVVTTTSSTLSSNKIHNGDIPIPANPGPPGKWPLKWITDELQIAPKAAEEYSCRHSHGTCTGSRSKKRNSRPHRQI